VGIDIVNTGLDVEQECEDPELGPLAGPYLMSEGQAGVEGAKSGEGAALFQVEEAPGAGVTRQHDRHDLFQDFGYCLQKEDNKEVERRVVGCCVGLVEDDTVCFLPGGGMVLKEHKRG